MKETPLCKLAFKYGTDKCLKLKHAYTPYYYERFKDMRMDIKKVFEMGIGSKKTMPHVERQNELGFRQQYQTGASLRMWRDFFPNAQIYGADIRKDCMFEDERIKTYLCDEKKEEDIIELVRKVGSDIDIFIDDASHHPNNQLFLARTILPLLQKDVIYIIEDVGYDKSLVRQLEKTGLYDYEFPHLPGRTHSYGKIVVVRHK